MRFGKRVKGLGAAVVFLTWFAGGVAGGEDHLYKLQSTAVEKDVAPWGHWGLDPQQYASWHSHSNRLVPIYTFGLSLDQVRGPNSVYRDAKRLKELYGRLPEGTLNPQAEYLDQTDVYRLQQQAAAAGKKYIFLIVFDGLDWTSTRAASIYYSGKVGYQEGRGEGLLIQSYRGAPTDFGFCVTSPHNEGTEVDVDAQAVKNPGGKILGGYDAQLGGATPWETKVDLAYLIGQNRQQPHAFTDSAPSACSMATGVKTYNGSINVDPQGKPMTPLARTLQADGWGVGVVTSVPMSHATPAAMYANNVSRDDFQDLTRDLVGLPSISHRAAPLPGLDVVAGAGWGVEKESDPPQGRNFEAGPRYFTRDTLEKSDVKNGGKYRVVHRTAGVNGGQALHDAAAEAAEKGERLLAIFGARDGHLPFATADGDYHTHLIPPAIAKELPPAQVYSNPTAEYTSNDRAENPTLAGLTRAALQVLEKKPRFWLMVEAGDVDWASHGNNLDNMIGAVKSGDEAFRAVVEWIERHDAWPDSAVIVTADHGHLLVLDNPTALIPPTTSAKAAD